MEVPFYALDYQIGKCKLNRLDNDADVYLNQFLQSGPGKDYKKETCCRLSWHYLIHGDMQKFQKYKQMVSTVGSDLRDRDLEAIMESNLDYTPHVNLLKARLLFDGGYFDLAMQEINKLTESSLTLLPYKLEYHYRKGRIYQKTNNAGMAISEFYMVLTMGRDEDYSFATRTAYSLGEIYEAQGNLVKAKEYYELCKDLYDSDYTEEGVLAKAERGMERVNSEE
jgi:tetratricopeptide (TPR) repeat protein